LVVPFLNPYGPLQQTAMNPEPASWASLLQFTDTVTDKEEDPVGVGTVEFAGKIGDSLGQ